MNKLRDNPKIGVLIVEDHPMFRERLAQLINEESDMYVCAQADNIIDAFDLACTKSADVAIIDITLKGSSGLELIKNLRAAGVDLPILVLSMHDESLYAERVLRAGAKGYITKDEAAANVMSAIRQVLAGNIYMGVGATTKILRCLIGQAEETRADVDRLTDRELEVFGYIGRGHSTREISIRLNISPATVDSYRARIKEKLGLANAAQLQEQAARWLHHVEELAPAVSL